jgi:hypothetical protein
MAKQFSRVRDIMHINIILKNLVPLMQRKQNMAKLFHVS